MTTATERSEPWDGVLDIEFVQRVESPMISPIEIEHED